MIQCDEWVETTELDVFFNGELFETFLLSLPSFGYIKNISSSKWIAMSDFLPWASPDSDIFCTLRFAEFQSPPSSPDLFVEFSTIPEQQKRLARRGWQNSHPIPAAIRKGKMTLRLLKDSKLLGDPGMCFVQVLQCGGFQK